MSEKMPNFLQEQDGCWSMRRILALAFGQVSLILLFLVVLAPNPNLPALYAAGFACLMTIILLFFTTWESIAVFASKISKIGSPPPPTNYNIAANQIQTQMPQDGGGR